MSRTRRIAPLLFVLVVLLTGCMRVEVVVKIEDDGSGTMVATMLVDGDAAYDEIADLAGQGYVPFLDEADFFCDEWVTGWEEDGSVGAPGVFEVEPARDGDWCGLTFTDELPASLDHSAVIEAAFTPGSVLHKVGDEWVFDARFDEASLEEQAPPDADVERMLAEAELVIEVDLPGVAVDGAHNADDADGGTFTWVLHPGATDRRMFARTEPAPPFSFSPPLLAGIGAAALGVIGIGWFFLGGSGEGRDRASGQSTATAAPANVAVEPYFDHDFGVWVREDPVQGRLWHDTRNDRWVPF